MRNFLRRVSAVIRNLLGAPNYERYLQHVLEQHPGTRPLGRSEFVQEQLNARYSRPGSRCC